MTPATNPGATDPHPDTSATDTPTSAPEAGRPVTRRGRWLVARWWVFTTGPPSVAAVWRLSGVVDTRRIPGGSSRLAALWWWSIRLDRVVLVALATLALLVAGPLLWCAARPSRRLGLYLVVAGLLLVLLRAGG